MYLLRISKRATWLVLALWFSAFAAGCSSEKPVGDAQKFHPDGIGIDIESAKVPSKTKS